MKKHVFSLCVIVALVLMVGCATLSSFFTQDKTDVFTLALEEDKEIPVNLPKELSSEKFADVRGQNCWDLILCIVNYNYNLTEKDNVEYEHVNFWIHYKDGSPSVIAIVWVKRLGSRQTYGAPEKEAKQWLYVKGLPVAVERAKVQELLDKIQGKGPK